VDITSKWINESPAMLKSLFSQAAQQPCVLFIDELDSVAKDRSNGQLSEEDRKMVTALLTLLDEARSQRIVLVAATNYIELLDKAAMREGRFDYRIEVPYPDLAARIGILTGMLAKFKVDADAPTIQYVAALWERRSVAFIESTVKRLRDGSKGAKSRQVSVDDFKQASREASRRSGNIPASGAKLSELALTASVRREAASLVYRLLNWERIAEQGGEPPSGVLLYGPPGTGKTNLVRALARELEYWHVFEVNATEVLRDPRKFTDTVQLAADHRPAIVFIDEADELLRDRSGSISTGATNEILKCMDGLMGKVPEVVFMAATNNPDAIDAAALRGGRLSEKIFMGKLSGEDLVHFLRKELADKRKVKFAPEITPESLAAKLGEVSPADAISILKKAVNYTFGADTAARMVTMADVESAMVSNVPSLRSM
jgi:transitional endoplasmic reticulum ATPase